MPRLPVIIITAGAAVALAFLTMKALEEDTPGAGVVAGPADPTITGRTPAFHLSLADADRERVARECLDRITSGQARALGGVKDDLALLSDDPRVIRMILEDWRQRGHVSRFEAAGFGDLFARIKHREFIEPGVSLLDHDDFTVRHKAVEIAATQVDPRFVPGLTRLFSDLSRKNPGEGMLSLGRIVSAARVCGGDQLPVLLSLALGHPIPHVRDVAAAVIREDRMGGLRDRLVPLLKDGMPQARLQAAWGLASFGDPRGRQHLLDGLDPREPALAVFCMEAVRDLDLREAIPVLKRHMAVAKAELKTGIQLTLALMGDEETMTRLRGWAADEEAPLPDRVVALMALAAVGAREDLAVLRRALSTGVFAEVQNIAVGLSFVEGAPNGALAKTILGAGVLTHTAQLGEWLPRMGDDLVPWLGRALEEAESTNDAIFLIGCLGLMDRPTARDEILRHRERFPRLVEEQVRLMDLAVRRRGGS